MRQFAALETEAFPHRMKSNEEETLQLGKQYLARHSSPQGRMPWCTASSSSPAPNQHPAAVIFRAFLPAPNSSCPERFIPSQDRNRSRKDQRHLSKNCQSGDPNAPRIKHQPCPHSRTSPKPSWTAGQLTMNTALLSCHRGNWCA